MSVVLALKNVHKRYQMGDNTVHALKGVSVDIEGGDFVAIMGPSGSGKSTLMHVLGLLDVPDEGSYRIGGREVAALDEDALAVLRRRTIGFIFQQFNLLPRMSAVENVGLPLLYSDAAPDWKRVRQLLARVGLSERGEHHPNELSGGQQQRVAIARALVNQPVILLADEPTGNLDSVSEKEIMGVLSELNRTGITVLIVTHEESIGRQAKRLIRMRDGVIQSDERLQPVPNEQNIPTDLRTDHRSVHLHFQHFMKHTTQAVRNLTMNKVRTALSMLGILIGVGAVVAMIAVGRGAQESIKDQLSSLGSNMLVLRAGAMRAAGGYMIEAGTNRRLRVEDALAIEEDIPEVRHAAPVVSTRGQVATARGNWNTQVMGVAPEYEGMHNYQPKEGRFFTESENTRRSRVALIGVRIVKELFGERSPIGEMIKINRISFQVIGVLPEKGVSGPVDQDDRILIPVSTSMRRLFGKFYVDLIEIQVGKSEHVEDVQDAVINLMAKRNRVPDSRKADYYDVRNMAEIQAAMSATTSTMTLLLSLIAAISLLVGGIGIMNIMLVSVSERTREIGLRKAVGATRQDILVQFLIEAIVISAVGGALGLVLAWLATVLLSLLAGWATAITFGSALLAFAFSATIGVAFGLYPARKASRLAPIDALRYE